jgi:carbonic anhydrase/acetyltransferase-like protein (isoleucine patch superfamily)
VIVGIGAIVLDGAEVGEDSIVAAGTLVPPRCIIPPRSFVMGSPARVRRQVTDAELEWIARSAGNYVEYARTYLESEGGSHPLPEGAS